MPVGPENLNIYAIERFSKNKYFELPFAEETRGVILNPFPMNDIFKIFDERFQRLKNFRKILFEESHLNSGYSVE